ncbi:MAG: glycosyltransferase, partial [Acutalibacteraceae bacterium]
IGDGTEFAKLDTFIKNANPDNMRLMMHMPKGDYDRLIAACDIGLVFLDHRFTIPNFPSRLLSYMQAGLPVLACTDAHTDIGRVVSDGGFGWWCESNSPDKFLKLVELVLNTDCQPFSQASYNYLVKNYQAEMSYQKIIDAFNRI